MQWYIVDASCCVLWMRGGNPSYIGSQGWIWGVSRCGNPRRQTRRRQRMAGGISQPKLGAKGATPSSANLGLATLATSFGRCLPFWILSPFPDVLMMLDFDKLGFGTLYAYDSLRNIPMFRVCHFILQFTISWHVFHLHQINFKGIWNYIILKWFVVFMLDLLYFWGKWWCNICI